MKKIITLVLFLLLLSAAYIPAGATVYLIENGSGGNSWRTASAGETNINLSTLGQTFTAWLTGKTFSAGDQVWLAKGTYNVTSVYTIPNSNLTAIYGGFAGTETNTTRAKGANVWDYTNETVIDGGMTCTTGFTTATSARTILYDGLTINRFITSVAIYLRDGGTIQNCKFTNNGNGTSSGGGAVSTYGSLNTTTTITGCYFYNNVSSTKCPGLSVNSNTGTGAYNISNCWFESNNASRAGADGSALSTSRNSGTAVITISNCTFKDNTAAYYRGATIVLNNEYSTIKNCLIYGTTSTPALMININGGNVYNCTFVNNTGGGARLLPTTAANAKIYNTVFWGTDGTGVAGSGSVNTEISGCIITNCALVASTTGGNSPMLTNCITLPRENTSGTNPPFFNNPTNNDWTIGSGSSLLDKADGTIVGTPTTDILGNTRGAIYDIGAYEWIGSSVTVNNSGFEDTPSNFTIAESGANVLYRVASIQDVTTQTTSPAVASGASITSGMWVKKAPNTFSVKGIVISADSHSESSSLNFKLLNNYTISGLELWSNSLAFQKLSLTNTQKYTISFWAKKDATANNQCSSVTVFLTDNTKRTLLSCATPLTGGTTWTQYSATFDIPTFKSANATADFTTAYMGFGINTTYDANTLKTNYSGVIVDDFSISTTNTGTITISTSANTGGSVTGTGAIYVSGANATVLATASSGYRFVNWTEGGSPVSTSATYTFTANANRTLVANFESVYTVAATSGTGGTMVSGSGTYTPNASATVVASANTGYRFVNWTLNTSGGAEQSTSESYTFTVTANTTLVANFEAATTISSGTTNVSTIIDNSIVTVASGAEITVGANKTLKSVTVAAGGKITITAGTLTTTDGITLESDENGTATLLNSGTLTSTVTAKQFLGSARNWYVSSPISSAPSPATNVDYYYEYMEGGTNTVELRGGQPGSPTDYWKGISNGSTMEVGKGYIAKTTAGTTVQFSGTPNNGDITTTFDLTRDDNKGKGFNLVGNPYTSYLDWSLVATANPNLDNTYYYRTKNTNITNTYTFVTWNGAGSGSFVVSNGSLPANTSITRHIPPTQAFWVRVKTGTITTKMNFNNGMREHRLDNNNLMKAPKQNTRTNVRLQLQNGTDSDELLIYQDAEASNGYDAYDSPKMMNNSSTVPDLYSKAGDERLVINGLNTLTNNTELPLGFSLNAAATLKLKATELNNLPEGAKVYLRDKQLSTETELTPATEYSFSTTAATTNNETRFSLLFRAPGATTATANVEKERISVFVNKQNQITIIAKAGSPYTIYNAMGQLIENGTTSMKLETRNMKHTAGVYVVKVNNQSTRVVVK